MFFRFYYTDVHRQPKPTTRNTAKIQDALIEALLLLQRSRHIHCVMVPMGQKAHQVRGLYRIIIRSPKRKEVSMIL